VRRNGEQDAYDEHAERARRLEILQRAESEFDPVPFDAEAVRKSRTTARSAADHAKKRIHAANKRVNRPIIGGIEPPIIRSA
jgi:hypothetical protein